MTRTLPEKIDALIRERRTSKVLAETALPIEPSIECQLEQLLSVSGWAPFHRACDPIHREHRADGLNGIEPWRFYALRGAACRELAERIRRLPEAGKLPAMLMAASGMIMATWLPNPPSRLLAESWMFEPTLGNMEHIAAASAATQNLLLAATARGILNYWSSGGVLRQPEQFDCLGIPHREILLGAIFLFPPHIEPGQIVHSKLRDSRCPATRWTKMIQTLEH